VQLWGVCNILNNPDLKISLNVSTLSKISYKDKLLRRKIYINMYIYIYVCVCMCIYIYIYEFIYFFPSFSGTKFNISEYD